MGGYCLSSLGSYYNQLKMARHYHGLGQEDLQAHCLEWLEFIQSKSETMFHRYLMVEYLKLGRALTEDEVLSLTTPEQYREWLKESHENLLDNTMVTRADLLSLSIRLLSGRCLYCIGCPDLGGRAWIGV